MFITTSAEGVAARDIGCPSNYYRSGNLCYPQSAWYWWGRWVLAGVIIVFVVVVLAILGCISSRRRRKRGAQPMYGTGWMAPGAMGAGGNKYNSQGAYSGYYAPPPAYGQTSGQTPYTGTNYNPNDGYYAGHNEGVQLQQPQQSYQRDQVYSPPAGQVYPPPAGQVYSPPAGQVYSPPAGQAYAPPAGPPPGK